VAGLGVRVGAGVGEGSAVGVPVGSGVRVERGVIDGIGVAQAARPAAEAIAPSWSSRRRLIGAGCVCIGSLSADAAQVGVLEVGRQLQAVAE